MSDIPENGVIFIDHNGNADEVGDYLPVVENINESHPLMSDYIDEIKEEYELLLEDEKEFLKLEYEEIISELKEKIKLLQCELSRKINEIIYLKNSYQSKPQIPDIRVGLVDSMEKYIRVDMKVTDEEFSQLRHENMFIKNISENIARKLFEHLRGLVSTHSAYRINLQRNATMRELQLSDVLNTEGERIGTESYGNTRTQG